MVEDGPRASTQTRNGTSTGLDFESETPTKCLVEKQRIAINCQITYIDFEGRSDGESIRKIVEQVSKFDFQHIDIELNPFIICRCRLSHVDSLLPVEVGKMQRF